MGSFMKEGISMRLKGSYPKEKCPFCLRDNLYEKKKTTKGRVYYDCQCGHRWLKESWMEMLTRTGKVWSGYSYDSDYEERILNNKSYVESNF